LTKFTEISVTGRGLSAGSPCHIRGKRQKTSGESFKGRAVIGRIQAARNWDDRRPNTSYCRGVSLSKAQRKNRLPVQIMVTFWIVAHPWPAMNRKHVFALGEEKITMISSGIEAPITQPFSF